MVGHLRRHGRLVARIDPAGGSERTREIYEISIEMFSLIYIAS